MPVKVKVDVVKLRALRRNPGLVLRELDKGCRDGVRRALDLSVMLVPVGDPSDESNLRETGFISGPLHNLGPRLSTTWTAGYAHPAAGAIHEGFHWGEQTQQPPPHFLRRAFRRARGHARKAIATQLQHALSRLFPPS